MAFRVMPGAVSKGFGAVPQNIASHADGCRGQGQAPCNKPIASMAIMASVGFSMDAAEVRDCLRAMTISRLNIEDMTIIHYLIIKRHTS